MDEIMDTIREIGLKPGCIDEKIDSIAPKYIDEIIEAIQFGENKDVAVKIGRKKYILEVVTEGIEPEIDLMLLTVPEYRERYGDEALEGKKW